MNEAGVHVAGDQPFCISVASSTERANPAGKCSRGHCDCFTLQNPSGAIPLSDLLIQFRMPKLQISLFSFSVVSNTKTIPLDWSPLWSSCQSSWLHIQRSWFDSRRYQIFWEVVGLERGPLSLVSKIEELLGRNSSGSGPEIGEYDCRDLLRWPRDTLGPQKLALTSPNLSEVRSSLQVTQNCFLGRITWGWRFGISFCPLLEDRDGANSRLTRGLGRNERTNAIRSCASCGGHARCPVTMDSDLLPIYSSGLFARTSDCEPDYMIITSSDLIIIYNLSYSVLLVSSMDPYLFIFKLITVAPLYSTTP
jgi:hypothetical protein